MGKDTDGCHRTPCVYCGRKLRWDLMKFHLMECTAELPMNWIGHAYSRTGDKVTDMVVRWVQYRELERLGDPGLARPNVTELVRDCTEKGSSQGLDEAAIKAAL